MKRSQALKQAPVVSPVPNNGPVVVSRSPDSRLHSAIERLAPTYVEWLRELVRIPSVTGTEQAAQAFVKARMLDLGILDGEVYCDGSPPYHQTSRDYHDRPSLVGAVPGDGTDHFILNAHVDTAPVEDESSWTHPPFAAVVEDGKLYGRGALDDKAGIAMMLLLAEAFLSTGIKLPGNLYLQSVIEDEDSGNGTLSCTQAGYHGEGAIILDGTWPWDMVDSHLGQLWLEVIVHGKPAPACSQARATNPIHVALAAIRAMEATLEAWNQDCPEWLGLEQPYWMNVGQIASGCWPGSVPERCTLGIQVGFPPPNQPEAIRFQLLRALKDLEQKYPEASFEHRIRELCVPPFWNPENRVTRALRRTICHRTELLAQSPHGVNLVTSRGHCDLRHMRRKNGAAASACLYGPGGGKNPHSRDEYYHLDHFLPVAETVASAILEFYRLP